VSSIEELRARLAEIDDLSNAAELLGWDERVMMPAAAAEARADQLATLAKVRHEIFSDGRIGALLEEAEPEPGTIDADLVRVTSRDWEKTRLVDSELRAEMAKASMVAERAWVDARRESDWVALLPHLERNFELARRFAACYERFPGFEHPYDPLLDEFEPEMSTAQMRTVLAELRDGLLPLVAEIGDPDDQEPDHFRGEFAAGPQRELMKEVLAELPFPEGSWRVDETEHPFAFSVGHGDIRMTTRYDEDNLAFGLFSGIHEAGHGLYEAGVDPELARTPLATLRSLGLHESQSRLLENWVGRDRPYLDHLLPLLAERFPDPFASLSLDRVCAAANRVERTLIRTEADEVTYNVHILIRFELEVELFEGAVTIAELPKTWNARYRDYLGLDVPDDARGVLQDPHWAAGAFGYFPTYSLGNMIAAQLFDAARRDIPDLETRIAAGELAPLGEWLREHVHRHGRRLTPAQILERSGCGELSAEPLLEHLRARLAIRAPSSGAAGGA
jgi:carboxypeptidase Taq